MSGDMAGFHNNGKGATGISRQGSGILLNTLHYTKNSPQQQRMA